MARKWMAPGEFKEVIQIGAVKVDESFSPLETFNVLIRPRLNRALSPFIQQLTGITNSAIEAEGIDFVNAFRRFTEFAGSLPIVAFGRDDLVLWDNIRLYGLKNLPPMPAWIDIRGWLMENGIDPRGMHACDVGPKAGVPFDGHTHDGLCDALSVAAGIKALMSRGARRPSVGAEAIIP